MTGKQKHDPVTGEVEVANVAEVAVAQLRDGDFISEYLSRESADPDATREQIHRSIIQEIMEATSLEDVLTLVEGAKLEAFEGRVIEIQKINLNDSDYEQGPKVYFSIKGIDVETGEKFLINTGEQAVMAQLIKIDQLASFPFRVRPLKSSRPNNFGRYPMRLTAVKD